MLEPVKRPRILIVEDHVLIQENIRLIVQRDCDVVATAEDGLGALAAAAQAMPDIVTVDVSLPGSSGFALAEQLGAKQPMSSVIFVSAYADRVYVEKAFELGARAYVLKGTIQTELPTAIREVTAGNRYVSPALREKFNLSLL